MHFLLDILAGAWQVMAQMAPYLLLGFLIAGALSVWISPAIIERHLGKPGLWQVVKAALFGVPIPLCSCSVIPVTASLRQHGASRGATIAFLSATPQTGVDSILVTHGLLGPVFTVVRVTMALLTGVLSGFVVNLLGDESAPEIEAEKSCCRKTTPSCCSEGKPAGPWRRMFTYGFVDLPGDIGGAILIGLLISGVLGTLVPAGFFAEQLGSGFAQMLVAMAVGIPFYVCSTASVPIAVGLMAAGMTPGAALVFLITGPATNAATFTTVARLLGRRTTAIYLVVLAGCALGSGLLLDALWKGFQVAAPVHLHEHGPGWFGHLAGVALLALLLGAWIRKRRQSSEPAASPKRELVLDPRLGERGTGVSPVSDLAKKMK
jgi:uncharacterized membrane protein YraQ (UPF0718 family)